MAQLRVRKLNIKSHNLLLQTLLLSGRADCRVASVTYTSTCSYGGTPDLHPTSTNLPRGCTSPENDFLQGYPWNPLLLLISKACFVVTVDG